MHDEPAERRTVAGGLFEGFAVVVCSDNAVFVRHRARDPRHIVVCDEAAQRRDETAAAPACNAVPAGIATVRDRAAVRDDDQLAAAWHTPTTLPPLGAANRRRPQPW